MLIFDAVLKPIPTGARFPWQPPRWESQHCFVSGGGLHFRKLIGQWKKEPFEDVSPIKHGDFSIDIVVFWGLEIFFKESHHEWTDTFETTHLCG